MNITLKFLNELGACAEGRRAFKQKFGADGAPTAREVFEALAAADRRDWAIWIATCAQGFLAAVGNVESGNWHASIDARIEATAGFVLASGSATVLASGSATVLASGSATVLAYDSATVRASGSATVRAYDSATVLASGSATVLASGSATVLAYDSATVRASGSATVEASGESNIILCARWSIHVTLTLSEKAVCIDRRGDTPKLLTTESTPTEQLP